MDVVFIILGVIIVILVLVGFSFLGWIFKGVGAIVDVFLDGLGHFFGTTWGCIVDIFIILVILAMIFG